MLRPLAQAENIRAYPFTATFNSKMYNQAMQLLVWLIDRMLSLPFVSAKTSLQPHYERFYSLDETVRRGGGRFYCHRKASADAAGRFPVTMKPCAEAADDFTATGKLPPIRRTLSLLP